MMVQVNCRGYAVARFMQPEPGRYAYAPCMEAKTFMQPEQPYYAHHPGRFVYIKDESNGALLSVPYEPVRAQVEQFRFICRRHSIEWQIRHEDLSLQWSLALPRDRPTELWRLSISNDGSATRSLSVYPYFPIGYMSWMNQSAVYRDDLTGIVASSITPYQKSADYEKNKNLKDQTYFLASEKPDAWEARQEIFEGEGGLHAPSGVQTETLANGEARYEMPAAVLQYRIRLEPGETKTYRFAFGPAVDDGEINTVKRMHLDSKAGFENTVADYVEYVNAGQGCLEVETPDRDFDRFVNHWLDRQIYYHGEGHRLSTDPQTRNYLQDNMGMSYVRPIAARDVFLRALGQQEAGGAMPDGVLVHKDAELKYINQVPHTDHCVWLPVCLRAYLDETDDYELLQETVGFRDSDETASVFEHLNRAMRSLLGHRDDRGLSYIGEGDWCDPMNMVGPKGQGVSGWLVFASAFALRVWSDICKRVGEKEVAAEFEQGAEDLNAAGNRYLWDGQWYARGITDDGVLFGVAGDPEGRIFLNPQSWAMLSGAADESQRGRMLEAIEAHLDTPYGVTVLAPAYTAMREDVGRVTQKHPGTAENGSVYNHAAVFYAYALYGVQEADRAYRVLRRMIPGPDDRDFCQRGQMPVFIPNYYRGHHLQCPQTAGRSSQLVHTGTVAWFYRSLIDGLFGVRGDAHGLTISPQLPSNWPSARIRRRFRGAILDIHYVRRSGMTDMEVTVDGRQSKDRRVTNIEAGQLYRVDVVLPIREAQSRSAHQGETTEPDAAKVSP